MVDRNKLADRVAKAAGAAPTIDERRARAEQLLASHPTADVTAKVAAVLAPASTDRSPGSSTESNEAVEELRIVPLDLIDPNPYNARHVYRQQRIAELSASIAVHGQETPGSGFERDGRIVLCAGHYRLKACAIAGKATMKVIIRPPLSNRALYEMSYRENSEREGQSALDNALVWRKLLDDGVYPNETSLAESINVSLPTVNKTLRILGLDQSIIDLVCENPTGFALTALYELVQYQEAAGVAPAYELALQLAAEKIGREGIANARNSLTNRGQRKQRETPRPYSLRLGGQDIGSMKEFMDSGRITLDVTCSDQEHRQALLAHIQNFFNE